ncbi:aminoglycoside phosphotransferase family protein [Sporosarcina aquimarina]|uniref:aminoglycoside phosphotransferase family protein n=1 Tax=Sporosarcina aquimarina TaxID=114975 RepID=UPI00203A6EF8|nr:aminoglycoside phosphotransferase family protein [Sporosarcina aquimarina]MCM3758239.1 aminoglycoside phosphotransferase family protein [Sporosarcina aquimarina]
MNLDNPIALGNTAKIYLSENKIVKVFNDFLPHNESKKEANKQKYAYSCGLPVPKVLDVSIINGKQAITMEYIKGESLGELLLKDKDQAESYLNTSVDMQLKVHSIIPDDFEPMHDKLYRQIEAVTTIGERQKLYLLKKLESFTFESKLCRGDFHLFNLLVADNEVVIIDWVDASAGDPRADVYRTYLLYSQFSTELAEVYLRLYCDKSGFRRSEVFQWAPVIAGARLSENVSTENSERLIAIINKHWQI